MSEAPGGENGAPWWEPAWAIHPGESLQELLDEMGLSQADLCRATGYTTKHVNQVCRGHTAISADMAVALEIALDGPSALFWCRLQAAYDVAVARERWERADG